MTPPNHLYFPPFQSNHRMMISLLSQLSHLINKPQSTLKIIKIKLSNQLLNRTFLSQLPSFQLLPHLPILVKTAFTKDKSNDAKRADKKLSTPNPGTKLAVNIKSKAFKINENSPRLKTLIGSVKNDKTGFTNIVINPHTTDTTNKACHPSSTIPGTK